MQLTDVLGRLKAEHVVIAGLFCVALTNWGENAFYSQAFVFAIAALAVLSIMTKDIIVAALGIYVALWLLVLQVAASTGRIPYEVFAQAVDSLVWITAGLIIYLAVRCGKVDVSVYQNAICILAGVLSIIGLISYIGKGQAVATLGCTNFLAAFLAISAMCCFRPRWWMLLIPIGACLVAAKTSTAIGAFLIGTGVYFLGWRGAAAGFAGGLAYFLFVKGSTVSLMERFGMWQDALDKIGGSVYTIVFGVGPGIYWKYGNMLHSEYAYLAWNLGLIGLALAAWYVIRSFRDINNRIIFAMFIAILVDGIGNHLMHTAPTAMLAVIVFGLKDKLRIPIGAQK